MSKDKDVENIFQNNVVFFHHEYLIYIYIIYIYIYIYIYIRFFISHCLIICEKGIAFIVITVFFLI